MQLFDNERVYDEFYPCEIGVILEQLVRSLHAALHWRHKYDARRICTKVFRVLFGILGILGLD